MVVAGQKISTANMTNKGEQLQKIVDLLKLSLSLDDEEIIKSTIEAVIELLEEEIDK